MRTLTILLAAGVAAAGSLLAPPVCLAQDEEEEGADYTREGWYLQAQGLYAFQNFHDFDVDDDAGFNVTAGWRGWEMFAGEFEFEFVNRFPGQDTDPDFRVYDASLLLKLYPLARVFEPDSVFNRFQPWLKAGPGWMWVERRGGGQSHRDRGDFAGRFGAGMDLYLTQHLVVVLSANYELPTSDVSQFPYLSAAGGIQYRFGSD
jgi:opacity protein-like surface antigen